MNMSFTKVGKARGSLAWEGQRMSSVVNNMNLRMSVGYLSPLELKEFPNAGLVPRLNLGVITIRDVDGMK